ncbi:hybrid sensor histidine kinase/response regulator transcription factor [Aridibaculum aurantiacum]|uniref:hybrid sensor histidine kinase/response regulator transcription factor n=1 Tax=Aridibaculum aurantiacum TaxID=2810307 RepID=UPI001A97C24A|nr:hybrid sensor histidine kinase/response regulator transcription factor [Aridibaculum aurantiacum]
MKTTWRGFCIRSFFLLQFLLLVFSTTAQKLISPTPVFELYNSSHGLPDIRIRNLFQDSQGYLWVGTMNGTCRYDGYNFQRNFYDNQAQNVLNSWAYAITEDEEKTIWFGTREGISNYNSVKEEFVTVKGLQAQDHPILQRGISTLLNHDGHLYIGTPLGLAIYNKRSKKLQVFKNKNLNAPVSSIVSSKMGGLWLATHEGVIRYNSNISSASFFPIKLKSNPYGDRIWSLLEVDDQLLIATAGNGLLKLPLSASPGKEGSATPFNRFAGSSHQLDNEQVFDIRRAPNGDIWLGMEHGLGKISGAKGSEQLVIYQNNPISNKSISNNITYKVMIDRDNNLWCGTEGGLNKLNLDMLAFNYLTFTEKDTRDQVRGLVSANGNDIWLGTANHGLFLFNTSQGTTKKIPQPHQNIRSLMVDEGQVWSGHLNGITATNQTSQSISKTAATDHAVFALLKDRKRNIWLGTNKGLLRITPAGDTIDYAQKPSVDAAVRRGFVRFVYEDASSRIWLGFENGGCGLFDPNTEKYAPVISSNGASLPTTTYYGIGEYPTNTFWLGSATGLVRVQLQQKQGKPVFDIKNFNEQDGLPGRSVNSVQADGVGNLWLATLQGVVKFNTKNNDFNLYLQGVEFGSNAGSKTADGHLLMGANDGFVIFDPLAIKEPVHAPAVRFTSLKLLNQVVNVKEVYEGDTVLTQPLSATKEIELNYRNNLFTIGFVGLHFTNPAANHYAYRLVGFDKDWIYTDASNRNITYTNLDAGDYVFEVKAANSSGKWSEKAESLKLTILPPPWKTWWAKVLYFLLFNALLFGIIWYFQVQTRQRNQLRFEQMEKAQIRKMNEMKTTFFTDISHEFRTPLSLIVSPVEELITAPEIEGEARTKLRMIHNNCKKLLSLINELMTFQKMEEDKLQLLPARHDVVEFTKEVFANFDLVAQRNKLRFLYSCNVERLVVSIDKPKLEIVLNNLLSNAFKFTPAGGEIRLDVELQQEPAAETAYLQIKVSDTGRGITAEEQARLFERFFSQNNSHGTGVGLYLTKKIVELHNGQISAVSQPGVRTIFTVTLPVERVIPEEVAQPAEPVYQPDFVTTAQAVVVAGEKQHDADRPTILLVEDNVEVLDYLDMLFSSEYNIIKAANGVVALQHLETEQPDLVISDVMMPEMDGITLCKRIKTAVETSHIQVILLTARATIDNKMEGLQTGADDYIAKPFHPEVLKIKARNLIETRRKLVDKYKTQQEPLPVTISENPLDKEFLENVHNAIEANLGDDSFGVEELGKAVFMSRSHLFRKMKALTGQNPLDVIYGLRLKKGMELLLERRSSISNIAYEVGFKSPSAFSAAFKKQYGKTPSEYVNALIQQEKA